MLFNLSFLPLNLVGIVFDVAKSFRFGVSVLDKSSTLAQWEGRDNSRLEEISSISSPWWWHVSGVPANRPVLFL